MMIRFIYFVCLLCITLAAHNNITEIMFSLLNRVHYDMTLLLNDRHIYDTLKKENTNKANYILSRNYNWFAWFGATPITHLNSYILVEGVHTPFGVHLNPTSNPDHHSSSYFVPNTKYVYKWTKLLIKMLQHHTSFVIPETRYSGNLWSYTQDCGDKALTYIDSRCVDAIKIQNLCIDPVPAIIPKFTKLTSYEFYEVDVDYYNAPPNIVHNTTYRRPCTQTYPLCASGTPSSPNTVIWVKRPDFIRGKYVIPSPKYAPRFPDCICSTSVAGHLCHTNRLVTYSTLAVNTYVLLHPENVNDIADAEIQACNDTPGCISVSNIEGLSSVLNVTPQKTAHVPSTNLPTSTDKTFIPIPSSPHSTLLSTYSPTSASQTTSSSSSNIYFFVTVGITVAILLCFGLGVFIRNQTRMTHQNQLISEKEQLLTVD